MFAEDETVNIDGVFYRLQNGWNYACYDANGNYTGSSQWYEKAAIVTYDPELTPWNNGSFDTYQGEIVIPDKVSYNGVDYPVLSIGSYAFANCASLKSLSEISNWETQKVENMEGMFRNCINLESINDISNWHTSNVKYMISMFRNCQKLDDISPLSNFDFSNVIDMNNIFAECSNLQDISNFEIRNDNNIRDISYMFYNCFKLEILPRNFGFNEDSKDDISYMFYNCELIKEENIPIFLDINHYKKAVKTEILKGLNKNNNSCLII
jgi:surface protein